jgi:iron complex outermembrane recepter protein
MLLALPADAAAQIPDSSTYKLPGVIVRGVRPITTVGGSSAVEVRIDSLGLSFAPTFETVFRKMPLLHVRRNSRGETEVSARGSESRQVAILVDGVPITLAWDARADISIIPATAPQEISYVRGLSSMLYGPNVLGGVLDVSIARTPRMALSRALVVNTGVDHVGSYGGNAAITLPFHDGTSGWVLRGGLGFRNSPGDPLASDVVERPQANDDLRLNTDTDVVDGFVSARYQSARGAYIAFSGTSFKAERGIAAQLGLANADTRFWRYPEVKRSLGALSAGTGERNTPFGRGDLELSIGYDKGRSEIDAFPDANYATSNSFEDGEDLTRTLRLLGDHSLGGRADLRAAFTVSDIEHDEFLPAGNAHYEQRLWSTGAEFVLRLIEGGSSINSLQATVGAAHDWNDTPEAGGKQPQHDLSKWGARAGLSMLLGGANTMLHAGVNRRGRFPSLRELYSGALNRFAPNPVLQPETLTAFEAGATTALGNGNIQLVGFQQKLEDAVVRITLPDRRFQRVNRNELKSTGLELLASQSFGRLSLSGDVTVQSVDLTDTSAGSTTRPENLPEVLANLRAGMPLIAKLSAAAVARYTGSQYCLLPSGQNQELGAGTRIEAELSRGWSLRSSAGLWSQIEVVVAADNITNAAIYDGCGLPQPGRLLRFQLRLR